MKEEMAGETKEVQKTKEDRTKEEEGGLMKIHLPFIYIFIYLEGGDYEGDEGAEGGEGVEGVDEDLSTVSSPPYPAWPGHHLFLKRGISQTIFISAGN